MKLIDYSLRIKPSSLRHKRGNAFFMVFDELYGILYIDLKMISGACEGRQ